MASVTGDDVRDQHTWTYRRDGWTPASASPWSGEEGDVTEIMARHGYQLLLDVASGEYGRGVMTWGLDRCRVRERESHPPYVMYVDDPRLSIHEVHVWDFPSLLGLMTELRAAGYELEE